MVSSYLIVSNYIHLSYDILLFLVVYCFIMLLLSIFVFFYFCFFGYVKLKLIYKWINNWAYFKITWKSYFTYRLLPHGFYESYTQVNINYAYYPLFYFEDKKYLVYSNSQEQYLELLNELDSLDDSSQVEAVKDQVYRKLKLFERENFKYVLKHIFSYTNDHYIYSFQGGEKDQNTIKHFDILKEQDSGFSKNYCLSKQRHLRWKDFIYDEVKYYHLNTEFEESYVADEEDFKYFPKSINPVGFLESLNPKDFFPDFQEFLKTDYCIIDKEAKELKKQVKSFHKYKKFYRFLFTFRKNLWYYFSFFNIKPFDSGYMKFTDTINTNFHFSHFLFFSHVYLQAWEASEPEETRRWEFPLNLFPDPVLLFFVLFPNFFYMYFLYIYIFNNFLLWFLFFFLHSIFILLICWYVYKNIWFI